MRYATLVADPPWQIGALPNTRIPQGAIHDGRPDPMPYDTLSVEEIAALPVRDLAQTNAHLYLWTINSYLEDAYGVARAWGFKPSTVLVWAKTPGMSAVSNGGSVLNATRLASCGVRVELQRGL